MKIKVEVEIDTAEQSDLDTIEELIAMLKELAARMKQELLCPLMTAAQI